MMRFWHTLFGFWLLLVAIGIAPAVRAEDSTRVGLGHRIGLGICGGAPTALQADVRFASLSFSDISLEIYYGVGMATWGVGEGYGAILQMDIPTVTDEANDALLLSPGIGFTMIEGTFAGIHGWWDLSPTQSVGAILGQCAVSWVHEFRPFSIQLAFTPGEEYGLFGRNKNDELALGQYWLQLSIAAIVRF